jgi:hypothetical protein
MKKYRKVISTIKGESPLLEMIQIGIRPEEIKEAVIESLNPYFDNKDILEQFAIEALVPESINLLKLQKDKWFFEMFKKVFSTYLSAKSKDSQDCYKSFALWQPQILQSLSEYWSIFHLEIDKCNLEIEEFLQECLRNVGSIIESVTKPYFKLLLHQIKIRNGIKTDFRTIDSSDLGKIIKELIQESGYADLFQPPPWNIRLNQWRNIAYHYEARIENDNIICWYGEKSNLKYIVISKNELLQVVHTASNVFKTLKLASNLFFVDNIKEISKFCFTIAVRGEAEFLNFAAGLALQGFEIINYKNNLRETKLIVKDVSSLNPDRRRLHASQFLFPLWLITKSKRVIVEYWENNNTPNLLVSVSSSICEGIYKGELEALSLAQKMDMTDLRTKKIIPQLKDD